MQHDMNNDLTDAQRELFNDPAIEAAFNAWAETQVAKNNTINLRKQFLLRIRALVQSRAIDR